MTRQLVLTKGFYAVVDDADYERVSDFKWRCFEHRGGNRYAVRTVHGKRKDRTILLHRFITAAPRGMVVDHINGDTLDNRKCNLRICSQMQNRHNSKPSGSAPGYKGVSKHRDKFKAQVRSNGETYYLGLFPDAVSAALAYDAAALAVHGEFARLNFPDAALSKAINAVMRGKP